MAREEQIKHAANIYATHDVDTKETDFYGNYIKKQDFVVNEYAAFRAGVKWGDENPKQGMVDLSQFWRDAEEEPNMSNKYIYILYVSVDNVPRLQLLCDILECYDYEIRWEEAVERSCIAKWAYMSDLLLKGGIK